MSSPQQNNSHQQSTTTWTEPPWSGWIETTGDALLILEAARRGLIPRVTRRLVDSERKMITSGSVFVFDEDESGIKRWTDGFFWSPSRILGNFLLYRETDKRGAGHRGRPVEPDTSEYSPDGGKDTSQAHHSLSRPPTDNMPIGVDKHRERTLMGSLTNSYKFKPHGLMKKTFSLTIEGVAQHLISYYKIEDVECGRLRTPSSLPELASLDISPQYLDKTHFRNPPKVELGSDGILRYRGEADDIETTNALMTTPIITPLLTERPGPGGRRPRPFPYASPPMSKRRRNTLKSSDGESNSTPTTSPISPHESTGSATPQTPSTLPPPVQAQASSQPHRAAYADSSGPPPPHYPAYSGLPGIYPTYHPPHAPVYAPPHPPPQMAGYAPPPSAPGNPSPQAQPQHQSTAGPAHYGYPGYPPHGSDPSQAAPAPYYQLYPPPPPPHAHAHHPSQGAPSYPAAYPPYQGVPWAGYSAYPPQHQPVHIAYPQHAAIQQQQPTKSAGSEDTRNEA